MSASTPVKKAQKRLRCEGCEIDRLERSFSLMYEENDDDLVCDYCRKYGPPMEDPTDGLDAMERQAILLLSKGMKVRPVARKLGVNEKTLRKALDGTENKIFRAAFQRMMNDADLGPERLIRVMKEATDATKLQWNPADGEWTETPDHTNRIKAAVMMQKVHGHEAPRSIPEEQTSHGLSIVINTNLGDGQLAEVPGVITARTPIDVTPKKEEPDDGS